MRNITFVARPVQKVTVLAAAVLLVFPSPSYAWDGSVSGKIAGIDVTDSGNYDFRVYLDSGAMCGNANSWAYITKSEGNYDAYVSMLTYAFAAGRNVTIHSNRDVNGYCRIGYINIR